MNNLPSDHREHSKRSPWPWPGEYLFGGRAEPVLVVSISRSGSPVLVREDGSMFAAPLHRVRLLRRDLP